MGLSESQSLLTAAERTRLREEMLLREELREELRNAAANNKSSGGGFWKSPVFATILAGLFLNLFSGVTAHFERRQVREHAMLDKRIAIASSVAQDLPTWISLKASVDKKRLWLHAHVEESAKDFIGASREDALKAYTELYKLLLHSHGIDAILGDVRLFFSTPEVERILDRFDTAPSLNEAKSDEELMATVKTLGQLSDQLRAVLAEEIKKSK
jgi:hypothetical protein